MNIHLDNKFIVTLFLSLWGFLGGLTSGLYGAELDNRLKNHPAPYLALHGDDPVAWQEWGEEVLNHAQKENKIILVSVGYFACHWCHVMQQESYQNQEVADILNEHFISVKVDRELEAALDNRLMGFAQRIIGRGGWPLNVFITPDGHPIYALLYAPKEQFQEVLLRLQTIWVNDAEKVRNVVAKEAIQRFPATDANLDKDRFREIVAQSLEKIMARADTLQGGFGEQNKFPSAPQLEFLLDQVAAGVDAELSTPIKAFLSQTLDAMATLGLNDHLSGGFFRYTVDPSWEVPHFEKMLYDNAQLATIFIKAGQLFDREDYHQVAQRTLDFMRQYMWLDDGLVASFSAVDDDSIEGGHYLWHRNQLPELLTDQELKLITEVWGLGRPSELEAGNHVRWHQSLDTYSQQNEIPVEEANTLLQSAAAKLLASRSKRSLPVDDKLLAGWNGLALKAFALAADSYKNTEYVETADALSALFVNELWNGKELVRAKVKDQIFGTASLEDYAYVAQGLWQWSRLSDNQAYGDLAARIARVGWKKFYKNNAWHREAESLLAIPVGVDVMEEGGATPAPAAVLISVSAEIANAIADEEWIKYILTTLNRGERYLESNPFWYVSQLQALHTALNLDF